MKLIKNKLIPEDECYLIEKNDIGYIEEPCKYVFPEKHTVIYLGKQNCSLDEAKDIYVDISYDEYNRYEYLYADTLIKEKYYEKNEE